MAISQNVLFGYLLEDLDVYLTSDNLSQILAGNQITCWDSENDDPKTVAARSLVNSIFKKDTDFIASDADKQALDKFIACNLRCSEYRGLKALSLSAGSWYDELIGIYIDKCRRFFDPLGLLSLGAILDRGRLGPGVNVGSSFTDFYSKMFGGVLTTTSEGLATAYRQWAQESEQYDLAERERSAIYGSPLVVEGNKLSFVPKTRTISRTICSEPILNMYFQLGFGAHIEDRLKTVYNIDLGVQPDLNRLLASLCDAQGPLYSTIDLESASDSISLKFLTEVLGPSVLGYLKLFRSKRVLLPSKELLDLHMVSSMGNGFTFPLQTALFACLVDSVFTFRERKLRRSRLSLATDSMNRRKHIPGNFGVFGDDIIVPNDLFDTTVFLLTLCGFKVNGQKSFSTGAFRESCGRDYYRGYDVRGVYIKTLRSRQSRAVALNLLIEWSVKHHIPLPRTLRYLSKEFDTKHFVPLWEAADAGIRVPHRATLRLKKDRFTLAIRYSRWVVRPSSFRFPDEDVPPKFIAGRLVNPGGFLQYKLKQQHGTGDGQSVGFRPRRLSYQVKSAIAPNWDCLTGCAKPSPTYLDEYRRVIDYLF